MQLIAWRNKFSASNMPDGISVGFQMDNGFIRHLFHLDVLEFETLFGRETIDGITEAPQPIQMVITVHV